MNAIETNGSRAVRAAVLCPSAWIRAYEGRQDQYDLAIGVNRAAAMYACDVWVCRDHYTFRLAYEGGLTGPVGRPRICTCRSMRRRMERQWPASREHEWIDINTLNPPAQGVRWRSFSATTAIVAAYHMGATRIDVYGMAWQAQGADADGFADARQKRTEGRFRKEAEIVALLAGGLAAEGVTLRRMSASGEAVKMKRLIA